MAEERGVVKYEAKDGQTVALTFDTIKRYLVSGKSEYVTPQEMMFFMGVCKSRGLNPFNRDCYLIKYTQSGGAAIVTSVDYFRKRARAQKDCKGWQKGIIVERNGEVVYSKGLMLDDDVLLGGWFRAQPEGWSEPFELEVNLKGYIKRKSDGSVTKFWSKENQPSQIAKVAESQGLRTLWPDEFQQLYTQEEMDTSTTFKGAEKVENGGDKTQELNERIMETEPAPEEPQKPEDPAIPCPLCDFQAKSERGLKKHITQSHPEPEEAKEAPAPDATTQIDNGNEFFHCQELNQRKAKRYCLEKCSLNGTCEQGKENSRDKGV